MRIVDLRADDTKAIDQVADLLVEALPNGWPNREAGLREVREAFEEGRISRVALDENGDVIGWIGGIEQYDGHVYERHPLAVRADHRRQGVGTALVRDLEERVRERGACTLWLGTDDILDETSLSGVDLYPDVWAHVARIRNLREHPYAFYLKAGFVIVGVLPDANGPGKPDIYMAKRIRPVDE